MTSQHQLTSQTEGISCFAWNADRSMIAVCPNSNEIHIYGAREGETWQRLFILSEVHSSFNNSILFLVALHGSISVDNFFTINTTIIRKHDLLVSSIDWSPLTNKIVSCSHDRNAFVWTFETNTQMWKPTLVILRIDRAATDVKWSIDGRRFAVASSAKVVPVCMYEPGNNW